MYTRLARFARESRGVFAESRLVKMFLWKIDKCLLNLALPRIIMEIGGRAILTEAFAIVERYDHACTDLVSYESNSVPAFQFNSKSYSNIRISI